MLKDVAGNNLQTADTVCFVPTLGALIDGVVLDVSGLMSVPGGPPMGIRKLKVLFMADLALPEGTQLPSMRKVGGADSEDSKKMVEQIKALLEKMKPGADGGKLILS